MSPRGVVAIVPPVVGQAAEQIIAGVVLSERLAVTTRPSLAGRACEVRALADGCKPGYASITADEWRDPTSDPRAPIDLAKKRAAIEKQIDLVGLAGGLPDACDARELAPKLGK